MTMNCSTFSRFFCEIICSASLHTSCILINNQLQFFCLSETFDLNETKYLMGQSHNFWVVHFQYNVFSWPFSPGVFINFIAIKDKQIISTKVKDGRAKV